MKAYIDEHFDEKSGNAITMQKIRLDAVKTMRANADALSKKDIWDRKCAVKE